jgi:hypothetical protein
MRDRKWDFCWARLRIIALDFWRLSRIVGKTILLTGALPHKDWKACHPKPDEHGFES